MASRVLESGRLTRDIWYMAAGDGPILVYLPGFGVHNKPLRSWQRYASLRAVDGLARHFRVYWINGPENSPAGATVQDCSRWTGLARGIRTHWQALG
ncbi:MAG: hypothetical protein JO285_09175, partial [Kutzneria sp.]|nr:hypothetical protein [Kutzneria sp.]